MALRVRFHSHFAAFAHSGFHHTHPSGKQGFSKKIKILCDMGHHFLNCQSGTRYLKSQTVNTTDNWYQFLVETLKNCENGLCVCVADARVAVMRQASQSSHLNRPPRLPLPLSPSSTAPLTYGTPPSTLLINMTESGVRSAGGALLPHEHRAKPLPKPLLVEPAAAAQLPTRNPANDAGRQPDCKIDGLLHSKRHC